MGTEKLSKQALRSRFLLAELEGKYFDDLTLTKFEKSRITAVEVEGEGNFYSDLPYISIVKKYSIEVTTPRKKDANHTAECDYDNKVIRLFRGRHEKDKIITLLHEMTHAYDNELNKYPTWRDYLLLYLYRKLTAKLGRSRVNNMISLESHPDFFVSQGHNLLFVLKCLELDLRLKKRLGTVFAYGREKHFRI